MPKMSELQPLEPAPHDTSSIVLSADHETSANALQSYMTWWGLENSDIAGVPLSRVHRLNEERPRTETTELTD